MPETEMKKKVEKHIGEKFKADWDWYVLLAVSNDGKTAYVRKELYKTAMSAERALTCINNTKIADRKAN